MKNFKQKSVSSPSSTHESNIVNNRLNTFENDSFMQAKSSDLSFFLFGKGMSHHFDCSKEYLFKNKSLG